MSFAHSLLLAVHLLDPVVDQGVPRAEPAFTSEGRLVRTHRGTVCIDGPHHPHRVHKLPGTAAMPPRNHDPSHDSYVHCSAETLRRHGHSTR